MRYSLTDIAKFQSGKTIDIKNSNGNIPIFGSNGIVGYTIKPNFRNKIIIGRVGANCGSIQIFKDDFWATDNTLIVSEDNFIVEKSYLYYLLKHLDLNRFSGGSAQPLLTQGILKKIVIDLPNKAIQTEISSKLNLIDNKIKNNIETIELLNLKLQTLYSYWFHQFEFPDENGKPYKSSGGKMVRDNEINREIPNGWKVYPLTQSPIGELINVGIDVFEGEMKYFSTSEIIEDDYGFNKNITYNNRESRANMQPQPESIWFAKMKNSVKHIAFINNSKLLNKVILSTGFAGIKAKNNGFTYLYCFINDDSFEKYKDIIASGSTQESITNTTMEYIKVLIPTHDVLNSFENDYKKYVELIYKIKEEIDLLKEYKRFLLPFILTGFPK